MLKIFTSIIVFMGSFLLYANCDIDPNLLNKSCSDEFVKVKNQKELDDFLKYGKFKNGELLGLEVDFNIKDKEINIPTYCNLKLSHRISLNANLNGICLKGSSIEFKSENKLIANKKAPIVISAGRSIILRRSFIETLGEIKILSRRFSPFDNEILVSKNSIIKSDKLTISTPSNLIINKDSLIRSSEIILDGGNCEIGDHDDQDNDDHRDRERHCKKFSPQFTYSGTCLNNPIPTNLKISSIADKADSLKLNYTVTGVPSGTSISWRFDDEFKNSNSSAVQSFLFPGKHLAEAVVSNSNGYFRKLGAYNNVSPTKFNKGQVAIFQFSGMKNGPSKVFAMMGLKKLTLVKSEQNHELYSGELPADNAGTKLVAIPEFGYKGSFNLVVLPTINNPSEYINTFIDSIETSLDELGGGDLQTDELAASLATVFGELKIKINSLSLTEQVSIAAKLQANTEGVSSAVTRLNNLNFKFNLLSLIIPSANAHSLGFADKFIPSIMKKYVSSDIASAGLGISMTVAGIAIVKYSIDPIYKLAGALVAVAGVGTIYYQFKKRNKIIIDLYDFIGNMVSFDAVAGETHTIRLAGSFIPVTANTKSTLLKKSLDLTNEFNNSIKPINENLSSVNSLLSSIGMSNKIVGSIPTLVFPSNTYQSSLSSDFITDVQLLNSDFGDVSLKSVNKIEDGIAVQFNATRSQNATVRIFYKNDDFNLYVYKDVIVKITVAPKAIINYTKNNLVVSFDSTDPQNPTVTGLAYDWNFGDGQMATTASKTFSHTYSQAGTYNVSLVVTDSFGASSDATMIITLSNAGEISYAFDHNDFMKVHFTVSLSKDMIGHQLDYLWFFPDGVKVEGSSNEQDYTFSTKYAAVDSFPVEVYAYDENDTEYHMKIDVVPGTTLSLCTYVYSYQVGSTMTFDIKDVAQVKFDFISRDPDYVCKHLYNMDNSLIYTVKVSSTPVSVISYNSDGNMITNTYSVQSLTDSFKLDWVNNEYAVVSVNNLLNGPFYIQKNTTNTNVNFQPH